MFKSFFQVRPVLDDAIRADEITLAPPSLAIFRLLLEHTFYDDIRNRYGFVNDSDSGVSGVEDIAKLTGYSERTVRDHLQYLEDAKLIHRQGRPRARGGRECDEITIIWATFHAEDEAEPAAGSVSDEAEPAALSTEPAGDAVSFLDKKERTAVVGGASSTTPSGENQAKASTRTTPSRPYKASRAKDDFPAVEDYLWDIEGCQDELASRLGMDPGRIDAKTLAKLWREMMVRHDDRVDTVSRALDLIPADSPDWSLWASKDKPVGYMLNQLDRFLAEKGNADKDDANDVQADAQDRAERERVRAAEDVAA